MEVFVCDLNLWSKTCIYKICNLYRLSKQIVYQFGYYYSAQYTYRCLLIITCLKMDIVPYFALCREAILKEMHSILHREIEYANDLPISCFVWFFYTNIKFLSGSVRLHIFWWAKDNSFKIVQYFTYEY